MKEEIDKILGQIEIEISEVDFYTVPPYTDGRRTCFPFFGKSAKRNWKFGDIIKNKCYLCRINRKKIELFNQYEMASVHIAALNG